MKNRLNIIVVICICFVALVLSLGAIRIVSANITDSLSDGESSDKMDVISEECRIEEQQAPCGAGFSSNAGSTECDRNYVDRDSVICELNAALERINSGAEKREVSILDYGAIGDGTTDDSSAFFAAIQSGADVIHIPEGIYNLDNSSVLISRFVAFSGADKEKCILKNVNITATSGLKVENLTVDGGAPQSIKYQDKDSKNIRTIEARVMFNVTPASPDAQVVYANCVFYNTDYVSYARHSNSNVNNDGKLYYDISYGCEFFNINKAAIYHRVDNEGIFIAFNNYFHDIGNTESLTGIVAALSLGDITNNSYEEVRKAIIYGNRFDDLFTSDDFSGKNHIINASFVQIYADTASICNNSFRGLHGYGADREAIYTKVRELYIGQNSIIDGGYGEGYICNKGHDGKMIAEVVGNELLGDGGGGIVSYGNAEISSNKVKIANCKYAINVLTREDGIVHTDEAIIIIDNELECGSSEDCSYLYKGNRLTGYGKNTMIKIYNPNYPISIVDNRIRPLSYFFRVIDISSVYTDAEIRNNIIDSIDYSAIALFVSSKEKYVELAKNIRIQIFDNDISLAEGGTATRIRFDSKDAVKSNRVIKFENNTVEFAGNKGSNDYLLKCFAGNGNADELTVDGNTYLAEDSEVIVEYNVKSTKISDQTLTKTLWE